MRKKMKIASICTGLAIMAGLCLPVRYVRADEIAEKSRKIMDSWQDAVVITKLVVEMYESERKIDGLATIIDPSGLAVISLSSIDPGSMYSSGGDTKVKSVKLVLSDNTEISSKIVLRDQDLDLAFIRPLEKPGKALVAIDLTKHATPDIMDQVVILSRLGTIAGNTSAVSLARIQAIIEKPRTLYMPDPFTGLVSGMGTPVFNLDGKVIGILLLRVNRSQEGYSSDMSGGISGMGMLPVVLPAGEILDVMKKSPELKD